MTFESTRAETESTSTQIGYNSFLSVHACSKIRHQPKEYIKKIGNAELPVKTV